MEQINLILQGLEATLSDSKKKYDDKVSTLLSAWEHVTNFIPTTTTPEQTQALIEWAYRHTLPLVLRGQWPNLSRATKTHLLVTLQRCAGCLREHPAAPKCSSLISLVENPWESAHLTSIFNDIYLNEEDEEEFCCSEKSELLMMRLKVLCEDRCEDLAVKLAAACVRSLRRSDRLRSVSDISHIQYMIDVYIVLLFKLHHQQDMFAQLKLMDFVDQLELVQRLSGLKPTKYGTARVWKSAPQAAELAAQYLVMASIICPISEMSPGMLEQILNVWAKLHLKMIEQEEAMLAEMIRKLIEPAESAQHIYIFCGILVQHSMQNTKAILPILVELYIRALTTDMNELESQKNNGDKEKEEVCIMEKHLCKQFLKLAELLREDISIYKECVLTAFSYHPTQPIYEKICDIAILLGKVKGINDSGDSRMNQTETKEKVEQLSKMLVTSLSNAKATGLEYQGKANKTYQATNKLLKNLLALPTKKDTDTRLKCNQHVVPDELCFDCTEHKESENALGMIMLAKGTSMNQDSDSTASSHYNKLGLSEQLCNDLATVWSSQRYNVLSWTLEWKELKRLCENYLQDAQGMRAKIKELKYLNIDYSQFKDWPSKDDPDKFGGIEKGYENWVDTSSDGSGEFGSFQPAGNYKRLSVRQSLDDSSDSVSSGVRVHHSRPRRRPAHRRVSSESEYDSAREQNASKCFMELNKSISGSDTNTQDSQTDSLGSDGYRRNLPKPKKELVKNRGGRPKKKVHKVENNVPFQMLNHPFHMLVNDVMNQPNEDVSGSDVSNGEFITLFSADVESKRETIKVCEYVKEQRSDPNVLKGLGMYRSNKKKSKKKDNNNLPESSGQPAKFAPLLNNPDMNPKIVLTRSNHIENLQSKKKKLSQFKKGSMASQTIDIKSLKGRQITPNRKSPSKSRKSEFGILDKAAIDSEILVKQVPGMNSLDMMVPPRVQSTVNVVQLARNVPQSPNSGSGNSGHTPPANRTPNLAGNIQFPGTPMSVGHDSGVGMSPAGQTPPPRPSSLHDVSEETNHPLDASPADSTNAPDSRGSQSQSPKKSPSPSSTTAAITSLNPINSEQNQVAYPINTNSISSQRNVLTLHNDETFPRQQQQQQSPQQQVSRNTFDRLAAMNKSQSGQNTGLPKFQQAFGKTIYPTTTATTSSTDSIPKTVNLSKAVQTSVPSTQQQSSAIIANIPNLRVSSPRYIIQNSAATNSNNPNVNQAIAQLHVHSMPNASSSVIFAQKIPVTISTTNANQLNVIPTISHDNAKVNVAQSGMPIRSQNLAVLVTPRMQQLQPSQPPTPQQPSQQQQAVRKESLINSPIEVATNQTTLEQLAEFESVLEQVKERKIQPQQHQAAAAVATTTSTAQTQTAQNSAKFQQLVASQSSSSGAQFSSNSGSALQQQLSDGQQIFPQKVTLSAYPSPSASKITNSTPAVATPGYCQPSASPALSATSQSSSSPCVTPAPSTTPSAGPKNTLAPSPKASKKTSPKAVKSSATNTSNTCGSAGSGSGGSGNSGGGGGVGSGSGGGSNVGGSGSGAGNKPVAKPQQKPQEDEQLTQRIYAILTQYAEQLQNSPDLNNKPAPRRRSNPPTNPSQNSKKKKLNSGKSKPTGQQGLELSPSVDDLGRTMGSEDSSSGVAHVQDSPAGFSSPPEEMPGANDEARNDSNDATDLGVAGKRSGSLIFTEQQQPRAVIVQEAVSISSVSEALASVTGKIQGSPAVLVQGNCNYILPMIKGGQQLTIVSGGSKFLATMPATVRSSGAGNALVFQSILNQGGKFISQQAQVKPVKLPSLQQQGQAVVIPQNSGASQLEETGDKAKMGGIEVKVETSEAQTPQGNTAILVNKGQAIGIIPRNIGEEGQQQFCGVIASNPNMPLQGARLFANTKPSNSVAATMKTDQVVCLAPVQQQQQQQQQQDKRVDGKSQGDKQIQTIALAFTTQADKLPKDARAVAEATSSSKILKRKLEEANSSRHFVAPSTVASSGIVSDTKIGTTTPLASNKSQPMSLENSQHYLSGSEPSNSNTQESSSRESMEAVESKVGNGVLCGNARLQQAWEPERKTCPDTPWRFMPAALNLNTVKSCQRDSANVSGNSVLPLTNKSHTIEIGCGQSYQSKKYLINNSLETYQHQYSNKCNVAKAGQRNARPEKERLADYERLQKSLSEECEDLGVDEPSTSDLFPEADLLFDPNHSPSFDQSSQDDASCSQSLGRGTYNSSSCFRSLDASSGSRDLSPVTTECKMNERRKNTAVSQRTRVLKESLKRSVKAEDCELSTKHAKLNFDILNQDSVSSNSDSRLSPGNLAVDNDVKESKSQNGSKEGTPSSSSASSTANSKMEMEMELEGGNVNNTASSGDESLTLLGTAGTADITISLPVSSISGPHVNTHKYTYANKKRRMSKGVQPDYLLPAWESPVSEMMRSSSEDEEDSSIGGESSQNEDCGLGNGLLEENARPKIADHCTYSKKDKLHVARVVLNRADVIPQKRPVKAAEEQHVIDGGEISDDEHNHDHHASSELDCRARRSSLRGHVKKDKGCSCCNGSPERPVKKKLPKLDNKLKKKPTTKLAAKKR